MVAREEAIAEDTWAATYVQCMADSGYTNYKAEQGGYSAWSEGTGPSVEEQVASYVCQIRFPWAADPRFVLSDAQREYVYTYYAGFLIPCLEIRGHAVVDVPSRDEFLDIEMGVWNPYYVVELPRDRADDERLRAECPEMPVGLRE
ncbi:hypothetical protein HD599_001105 [Conyzicola lurida]|uniref:Uncharacterized protein n=1 Tax=Conyzicola lurida TaxID=1172621 RepID=A0A841ALD3_9MICO|nr:hypothetical protein [Conyzicola lurida]MBB5842782.1 hypothetical protein [Conyzicola lurida]